MKIIILIFYFITLSFNNVVLANSDNCGNYKKFSAEFFKCKGKLVKDKTISASKNIIKDTKNYQKNKWSEEKEKVNEIKKKVLE
tara:strand:+ start:188 stop:439 length:252 start_codon:yes stop_codon:yes gene_type:complete